MVVPLLSMSIRSGISLRCYQNPLVTLGPSGGYPGLPHNSQNRTLVPYGLLTALIRCLIIRISSILRRPFDPVRQRQRFAWLDETFRFLSFVQGQWEVVGCISGFSTASFKDFSTRVFLHD